MLVSNFITVQLTGHYLVPWLSHLYEGWLQTSSKRVTWLGITSVLLMQLFLLTLFSLLQGMAWDVSDLRPHAFVGCCLISVDEISVDDRLIGSWRDCVELDSSTHAEKTHERLREQLWLRQHHGMICCRMRVLPANRSVSPSQGF